MSRATAPREKALACTSVVRPLLSTLFKCETPKTQIILPWWRLRRFGFTFGSLEKPAPTELTRISLSGSWSQSWPCSGFVHVAERYKGTTDRPAGWGRRKMVIHYRCVRSNTNTRRADPRVDLPFPFALACQDDCHGWILWDCCSDESLICLVERRLHHQYPM